MNSICILGFGALGGWDWYVSPIICSMFGLIFRYNDIFVCYKNTLVVMVGLYFQMGCY